MQNSRTLIGMIIKKNVAGLYVALRTAVVWCSPPGYKDYRAAAGTLALSLCILSALAMCFYKAFRSVTVFLVVSFQAVMDISSYVAAILINKPGNRLPDMWNWCVREGIITSEKSYAINRTELLFILYYKTL